MKPSAEAVAGLKPRDREPMEYEEHWALREMAESRSLDSSDAESSTDISREEEKWSKNHEAHLMSIADECAFASSAHRSSGRWYDLINTVLTGIGMSLPLMAAVANTFSQTKVQVYSSILLASSSIFQGIGCMLNLSGQSHLHMIHAVRLDEVADSISYTLTRSRKNREACDVRMQNIMTEYRNVFANAPPGLV